MKRAATAAAVGALLYGLVATWGPAAAQDAPDGFTPISIYSLDDGSLDDSVPETENTTPPGTAEGDPQPTEDRFGNPTGALACDGVDDVVQTQEPSNINPLTFSAWFRADDVSGEHSIVDSDSSGLYGHSLIIGYDDPNSDTDTPNDGSLSVQFHDGVWDTDVVIDQGEWTQVFVTYSDNAMKVYVGTENSPIQLVAEQPYDTTDLTLDGSDFRFCQHNPDDPQRFVGAIDDVRFYAGAIDPTDPDFPVDPPVDSTTTEPEETEDTEPEEPFVPECPPPDELIRIIWGDVHIHTLDQLVYDFQFTGDFTAAQTPAGDPLMQARMSEWDNPRKEGLFSVNTAVAMDVGGDEVVVTNDPDPLLFVNGVETPIPTTDVLTLPNGGTITPAPPGTGFAHDLGVGWPDGRTSARVQVSERPFLDLGLCSEDPIEGLIPEPDGDPDNDMVPNGGEPIEQPATLEDLQDFGDSWRVPDEDSLFPEPLPEEESQTPDELITLDDLPEDALTEAEEACAEQGLTDPIALHNCTYDVAATGDPAFVDSAEAQEEAVEALPEEVPAPVAAIEEAAPQGVPIAGTDIVADSDPDSDDGGVNPLLFVGLGALALVLAGLVAALVRKGGGSDPGAGTPTQSGGPTTGPAPGI